ncbi:MAG: hypothetical protein UZ12_BCD005000290 [Bacteroidetes bacterium OLB12]|nr:MAG: hypothetical protein UZ12_BCD005000290 [Bacteroidetes bacterium OLB12]
MLFGLIASKCEKEEPPFFQELIFVLNLEINPKDSIVVKDDTLWITAEFNDSILEYNSNKHLKIPDFDFLNTIGFFKLIGNQITFSNQPGAIESFQFINTIGSISNLRDTFADFNLTYDNNNGNYSCKIGVIPKTEGVFSINFLRPRELDLSEVIKLPDTPEGRKVLPFYRNIYYVINGGQTNFDLYKKHCIASSERLVTTDNIYYEQKGTFTFRVID